MKYFTVLKIGIQEAFEYRSEIVIYMMGWSVRLIISTFLFTALLNEKGQLGDFNLKKIITYFLIIQILTALNFARTGSHVSDDIQSGDFSNYLLKPISYPLYHLFIEFSKNMMRFLISLVIFGIILIWYEPSFFNQQLLVNLPFIIVISLLAYIMSSLMSMGIGMLAFWIVNARRIIFMYFAIMSIFSGMMIPISLFPENIQKIIFLTPFPYLLHIPAEMALGFYDTQTMIILILKAALFAAFLFLIVYGLYGVGLKKYEAVGR